MSTLNPKQNTDMRDYIKKILRENLTPKYNCDDAKVTDEISNEIKKYNSSEELLRAGGISDDALCRAAFGFTESDIKTLMPKQLKIKWKSDWENVKYEQEKSGLSKIAWSQRINLSEPIDVVYEKGKFYVDDGHHRTFAAMVLKKPLNVNLEINENPILRLGIPDYDAYHRCAYKKIMGHE